MGKKEISSKALKKVRMGRRKGIGGEDAASEE
jgi:hypothetical protein